MISNENIICGITLIVYFFPHGLVLLELYLHPIICLRGMFLKHVNKLTPLYLFNVNLDEYQNFEVLHFVLKYLYNIIVF
jgi:hypothetical protein